MVTPASEASLRERCTEKMSYNVCLSEQDSPKLDDKVLSGGVEKSSWGHHLLQTQIWSPVPFPLSRTLRMPAAGQSCVNKFGCRGPGKGPLYQRPWWAQPRLPGAAAPTLPHGLSSSTKRIPTPQCVATWAPSRLGGVPGLVRSCTG